MWLRIVWESIVVTDGGIGGIFIDDAAVGFGILPSADRSLPIDGFGVSIFRNFKALRLPRCFRPVVFRFTGSTPMWNAADGFGNFGAALSTPSRRLATGVESPMASGAPLSSTVVFACSFYLLLM